MKQIAPWMNRKKDVKPQKKEKTPNKAISLEFMRPKPEPIIHWAMNFTFAEAIQAMAEAANRVD